MRRRPNEAYINVPSSVMNSGFFPPPNVAFSVVTDDGHELRFHRTGRPPKNLQVVGDLEELGRYFRRRLGVSQGSPVTIQHLRRYGRQDVEFTRVGKTYQLDFSSSQETPRRTRPTTNSDADGGASGQGFSSDAERNAVIETHAMELALNYLRSIPWRNIRDTSASKPYDYVADSPNGRIYIEVKGTTSSGESINLTKNEVAHFTEHAPNTALVLISNIKLIGLRPVTNSGSLTFICPWNINSDDLTAVQYRYEITPASRRRKPVRR